MAAPLVRHPGELRWETRLLAVVVLTLLVFGVATVYGAAGLQTRSGGNPFHAPPTSMLDRYWSGYLTVELASA